MTEEEMISAIVSGKHTKDLIEELIEFQDRYDHYGVLEYFGNISKKTNRAKLRKDIKQVLKDESNILIEELQASIAHREDK